MPKDEYSLKEILNKAEELKRTAEKLIKQSEELMKESEELTKEYDRRSDKPRPKPNGRMLTNPLPGSLEKLPQTV